MFNNVYKKFSKIQLGNNYKGLTVTPRPIRAGAARRLSQNVIQETKTQSEDGLKISINPDTPDRFAPLTHPFRRKLRISTDSSLIWQKIGTFFI